MDMTPQTWPEWYDGRHINEVLFCQQFLEKHPMKCVRGRLFTVDGLIEDEGADWESYFRGNLRLSDLRLVQGRDKFTCQHQAASVFAAAAH